MSDTLNNLLLPIALFLLGFMLKKRGVLKKEDGDVLLRINFNLALPSLIFLTDSTINLSPDMILLPLIAAMFILTLFICASLIRKFLHIGRKAEGVFLISTMISNVGFTLPFIRAVYGSSSLTPFFLFDFGGGLMVFTFVYAIASKYGRREGQKENMILQKVLLAPPVWAIALSLLCNVLGWHLPLLVTGVFQSCSAMVTPLLMLALGAYFDLKLVKPLPTLVAVLIGLFVGFDAGVVFSLFFHLTGLTQAIVIVCCAAPAGYNTLTFSSLERLDSEFAVSIVSLSLLIGIFFIPLLLLLLKQVLIIS